MRIIKIKNIQNNKNDRCNNMGNTKNFDNNISGIKCFILNKIKSASVFLFFLLFLFAAVSSWFLSKSEAAAPHTGGPLSLFHKNTLYYTGTIIALNNTALKLSGRTTPLLFEINSSTVCYGGGGVNLKTASCSDYKKGQTVNITASKNTAGKLIAKTIKPVFY
ncbi:MAG: hypothetical protein EVJ46_04605 [Candidatus Acididesulfobacter guangdongensis]|uniref:DUF5666 domain-containing protein n=1 Tax=Acididesulfobacter guangdongensis TaxID=2597225 RepID=A0A519BGD5_ACIG2|nr:MAG: hypothetical protein EVJ46_04605 [Candidatus Acididesulfobacter guangdongensis]